MAASVAVPEPVRRAFWAGFRMGRSTPSGHYSGNGAPSGDQGGGETIQVYTRNDAATPDTVVYVSVDTGVTWNPLEAGGGVATVTDLTVTGQIDHDRSLTAAGDAHNLLVAQTSATGATEGIDVSVVQTTNARTAGVVAGVKSRLTSLVGDTGGVYADFDATGNTDGGGGGRHIGVLVDGSVDDSLGSAPVTAGGATAGTAAVSVRSGARVKTDANAGVPKSGAVTVASGPTEQNTALATGGASGDVAVQSGATDSNFAGATGGASGAVSVRSGHATASIGTSGATGAVEVKSGDSTSGGSGDVTVASGTAGGTRGNVILDGQVVVVQGPDGLRLNDASELRFGTPGTDLVLTPDGTDVVATGTGDLVIGDDVDVMIGTSKDHALRYVSASTRTDLVGLDVADGTSGSLRIDTGDSGSLTGAGASGGLDFATGASAANGAAGGNSGNLALATGAATVASAHAGGSSGALTLASGATDTADAAGQGGNSGNVSLGSGAATSSVGALSGNSGTAALRSGDSADGNSGDVILRTGSAGGTRGALDIDAATVDLATQATAVRVKDNEATAFQVQEGSTPYLTVVTTNAAERVSVRKPLRARAGMSRSEGFEIVEDFLAPAGTTLPAPWAEQDTSAAGAPTTDYVADGGSGQYTLAHDATDEVQTMTLYWGDQLMIDPTKAPVVEFRVKVNFAGATFTADQRIVVGLASDRNANLDLVANNVWFRVEGANLDILVEADDGTTDTDDQDSTINIVDNTWTVFRIDLSDLTDIGFFVDGVEQAGAAVSAPLLAGNLQPFIEIQKDAGVDADSVQIDYVQVVAGR